jgi:hypothetical protein
VRDPNGALNLNGDWTLEAWVKFNSAHDGEQDVIFYYGDPDGGYSLSVNYAAGNKLQVTTLGIADMPADLAVVEADVWQHLAVVHTNGQSITYFINGVEAETRAYTGGTRLAQTTKILYVGAGPDGALAFTGLIDRIRISNAALTANQLDSDPLNPAGPTTSTTYRFEDVNEEFFTIDGIHGGIDFGTGAWSGSLNVAGLSKAGSPSTSPGSFTLPAGKVLKAIRLSSQFGGTWRINDGVNPERSGTFAAIDTPVLVVTDWQMAAATVMVGVEGFVDDIAYGDPPPAIAPMRVTKIQVDRVTGNVTLRWEGGDPQFQVEKSATVSGSFVPASGLLSVREFTDVGALQGTSQSFYRVRRF